MMTPKLIEVVEGQPCMCSCITKGFCSAGFQLLILLWRWGCGFAYRAWIFQHQPLLNAIGVVFMSAFEGSKVLSFCIFLLQRKSYQIWTWYIFFYSCCLWTPETRIIIRWLLDIWSMAQRLVGWISLWMYTYNVSCISLLFLHLSLF